MPPVDLISELIKRRTRQGGSATSNQSLSTFAPAGSPAPTAAPGTTSGFIPTTSAVPSSIAQANAITPQQLKALLPQIRQSGLTLSSLSAEKPKPRVRQQQTLLDQLDRAFAPGEQLTPRQAALLTEAYGLPGKTYAQIGMGESNLEPAAVGHDPGGTVGKGWLQMTPGVQSPETVQKWKQIASQHPGGYSNPVAAVEMAKVIAGDSTGVGNYYGTGFVTDPNAHLKGGPQRAQRVLGMPASDGQASGGPYVNPFGKNISIGRTDMGIDPSGPGPIRAIGRAKYLGMGGTGWPTEGGSGTGPVYKLLQGPQQGKRVYTYEGITPRTDLQPGDILHKGEVIAKSTGSSFETGFAQGRSAGFQPLASPTYSEGDVTAQGTAFRKFVDNIQGGGGSYPTGGGAFGGGAAASYGAGVPSYAPTTAPAAAPSGGTASQQQGPSLGDILGQLPQPLQSSLSQSPLMPRTDPRRNPQDQQNVEQTLYDLLYGSGQGY